MKWLNTMIVGVLPQWQLNINFHCIKSMEILAITLSLFWHTQNEGISTILTHFTENQIHNPISNITIFNFYPFFQLRIT